MKKLMNSMLFMLAMATMIFLVTSCGDDEETPTPVVSPDACDTATQFDLTQGGTAKVSFLNTTAPTATTGNASKTFTTKAEAGKQLAINMQIDKGANRPQKMKVYASNCEKLLGAPVAFNGQPKVENDNVTIDLRNEDTQIRTVIYNVPTGQSMVYLTVEVDESGGVMSYSRLVLDVSGSGEVQSFTGVILGGNTNAAASRMSSSLGETYVACATEDNIDYIDITYAISSEDGFAKFLSSNPARFLAPISLSSTTASGCVDGDGNSVSVTTSGGKPTYFKASTLAFDDASVSDVSVSSTDNQYVNIQEGSIYEFVNAYDKKGLVRVVSITEGSTAFNGTISIDIKVEK